MRIVVLYHPNSEHEGRVLDFLEEYKRLKSKEPELVSLETPEGAGVATLYGITSYPAFLALSDDGQLQRLWQGQEMPMIKELDHYAYA